MAIISRALLGPTRQEGQYKTLIITGVDALSTVYVDAGFDRKGYPYCWQLVAAHMEITTSADVANRIPYLTLLNNDRLSQGGVKGKAVAASSAGSWDLLPITYVHSDSGPANSSLVGIGPDFVIQGNGRLNCFWIDGKANDVAAYYFMFKWLRAEL